MNQKGREYEKYVGLLYEKEGYEVKYNGIEKGSHDRGIDLMCEKGRHTVLVQCKCYTEGKSKSVSLRDVYHFYGSSRHYARKNPQEVVQSSFWTTTNISRTSEVFEAMIELGILLYDKAKMYTRK